MPTKEYNPHVIEADWQARWQAAAAGHVDLDAATRPFYNLMEFPYPSGEGLHVGHVFSFGGADTYGRFMRRQGYQVFQPIGYDAFGIHSENYALKIGAHPHDLTPRSIARFRSQLRRLGIAFDWSREVDTTSPEYYRWTQWIFLQLFRAGLAYRAEATVNWCPSCQTVLANEQVIDGHCERCDTPMGQRRMAQWFLRITAYADRLLDFSQVDFSPAVIKRQQAWIGRSEGAEVEFRVQSLEFSAEAESAATQNSKLKTHNSIMVFTTRPDTITAATFVALAPEHPLAQQVAAGTGPHAQAVRQYTQAAQGRLERERQQRTPDGVFSGLYAINPANRQALPVWVADYVLASYGIGAIMGVPAHDQRDATFAAGYGLNTTEDGGRWTEPGDGLPSTVFRPSIRYRLRDWLISRQRYWGPPIPIIYCDSCGIQPVPEEQLPVVLPPLAQFRPTGTGIAPLASVPAFVNTSCPQCGGVARRETDVSDNFLDSAWYFLRYLSTERADVSWDAARVKHWLPVAQYTGGPEHATMHHLYARFICLALYDLGLLPINEPFGRLSLHGTITKGGRKMSKSRGNVVNPDDYISRYGADATRMALLFLGPFDQDADFSDRGVIGMTRFLARVWSICQPAVGNRQRARQGNTPTDWQAQTADCVSRVTSELAAQRFHTAIAALMEYTNWLRAADLPAEQALAARRTLLLLLAPFAPHICEELWLAVGGSGSIHAQPWPVAGVAASGPLQLPVQVDGRVRGRVAVPADANEAQVRALVLAAPAVQAAIAGRSVARVVIVAGRVANVVTQT